MMRKDGGALAATPGQAAQWATPGGAERVSAWLTDLEFSWQPLLEDARALSLQKDQTLFHEGQPAQTVYVIVEGRVRLSSFGIDGRERHLMILGANGLLGDCSLPASAHYGVSALASSEVRLRAMPASHFLEALQAHPELAHQHRQLSSRRFGVLLQHIQLQAHNSAGRRVCHHLLGLLHAHGTPTQLGSRINISFTQQEMGNICGLSRVSVSHIFSRLERQGVIARHQRHVVICRPDLLALEAQGIGSGLP